MFSTGLAQGLCFGSVHRWWIFWPGLFLWQIFTSVTVFAEPILSMFWTYLKYVMSFYLLGFLFWPQVIDIFLQMLESALFWLKCEKYCQLKGTCSMKDILLLYFLRITKRNDIYYLALNPSNYKPILKFFSALSSKPAECCLSSDCSPFYSSFILHMINVISLEGLIQLPTCCWLVTFQMLLSAI